MKYLFDDDVTTTMVIESHEKNGVSITLNLIEGIGVKKTDYGLELTYNLTPSELNQLSGIIYHIKKELNEK